MVKEKLQNNLNKVKSFFEGENKKKRIVTAAIIIVAVIIVSVIAAVVLNNRPYETLFTGLTTDEASAIVGKLEEYGAADYKIEGDTIKVPAAQEPDLKAKLLLDGYPKSGFGYDTYFNNISMMASDSDRDTVRNYELQDRLVIVGNDSEAQEAAIRKGAGILVAVWTEHIEESVIALAKEYHCPIILSGHGTMNTSRYLFFSPPVKLLMKTDLVSFNKNEFVDEVGKKMLKSRYRSYPVIDDENHLIGYVSRYHILNQHNKKVILVDHNEYAQSVKSIEKADLLEVVDHHRVCDISTNRPISFRNEIIGSTASIITSIYLENQMSIPKDIAGLLLGAILSDTLKFKSPTTTAKDKGLARMLAEIAELDIDVFAKEMFKVSSNISNKTPRELLNQDIKKFEIDGRTVMISQVIAYQVSEAKEIEDTLQSEMVKFAQEKGLDLLVVAFTSILENGSVFYAAGDIADVVAEAFPNHFEEEHSFQEDILSRKNQIVPLLSRAIINSVH